MGFFSFTCAKTQLPILASTSWDEKYSKVVVLDEDGSKLKGIYDGYGRVMGNIGEVELDYADVEGGNVKLVLQKFYNGESFEALGKSHSDPGQGHFHDEEKIEAWYKQGGFKDYKDMILAYNSPGSSVPASQSEPINPYYNPEGLGLEMISFDERGLGYSYNTICFWATPDGKVYTARDSGCSCPEPFERHAGRTTKEVTTTLESVGSVEQALTTFDSWNKDWENHKICGVEARKSLNDWVEARLKI